MIVCLYVVNARIKMFEIIVKLKDDANIRNYDVYKSFFRSY